MTKTTIEHETFEARDFFRKAEQCIRKADYRKASGLLHEALRISPGNPIYLSHLGLCVGMLGDPDSGEKTCRKAIQDDGSDPILYVNLGRVVLERGLRQDARELFVRAYKMDNTNAAAALELSRMGVRRKPVIGFLDRAHPLNIYLGKLRYRMLCRQNGKKLKK